MKTLLLNPPSFLRSDRGASSRWPARREITSSWYPVWLAYPAGLIEKSWPLDGPPHGVSPEETVSIAGDYDFVVLYTSSPGFKNDVRLAEIIKDSSPDTKIAFVGPHVTVQSDQSVKSSSAIDFGTRKGIDYSVPEFASGKKREEIAGISSRKKEEIVHNPDRPAIQDLDALPFATEIYKRDLDIAKYNVPFLLPPKYCLLHFSGLSGALHFLSLTADYQWTSLANAKQPKRGC